MTRLQSLPVQRLLRVQTNLFSSSRYALHSRENVGRLSFGGAQQTEYILRCDVNDRTA